jgi:FixJ family two-component response regulator
LQKLDKPSLLVSEQHIFIIDDDEYMVKFLKNLLINMGYSVYGYTNAIDFLKAIPDVNPSILITDMKMAQMTGIELQVELIRLKRAMPVIFISGESTLPQSIAALKHGAMDFLLKPVNNQQLKTAVESAFVLEEKQIQGAINKASLEMRLNILSTREKDTYELMILGYNNTQILETLNLSLSTTKQYRAAVMRKLKLRSLSDLLDLQHI